jgi:3-dehydro-4-phosphotetronate decarboxylase
LLFSGMLAGKHHAVLLANHGPVVGGAMLDAAVNAIEELEQTAKLVLLFRSHTLRPLTGEQVADLNRRFPSWLTGAGAGMQLTRSGAVIRKWFFS